MGVSTNTHFMSSMEKLYERTLFYKETDFRAALPACGDKEYGAPEIYGNRFIDMTSRLQRLGTPASLFLHEYGHRKWMATSVYRQ